MALEILAVVGLKTRRNPSRQTLTNNRRCGSDVYRTGQSVFTKENPLRAAQHLDLLEIKQAQSGLTATSVVNAIDKHADRLLKRLVSADRDTAHADNGIHRVLTHRKIRHISAQLAEAADGGILNQLTTDCRDRNRHVLQTFCPLLRGHHDLF